MEPSLQCTASDDKVPATPTLLANRAKRDGLSKPACLSRIQIEEQQAECLAQPEDDTDQEIDALGEFEEPQKPEQDYASKGRRFSCGESSESSLALKHLMQQRRSKQEEKEVQGPGSRATVTLGESPLAGRRRFTTPSLPERTESQGDIADLTEGDSLAAAGQEPSLGSL
mmetsp:Transcript_1877/g.4465  ORF Transcript_1877/g.4465 Transcript_1877/m.4465 type:complete len:170 (-) Transcript_1877:179-688(-)